MMRKALLAAVVVTAAVSSSIAANFELGINAGYGFGMGSGYTYYANETYKETPEAERRSEHSEYKPVYISFGKGLKIDINADIYFNDNFGLTLLSGISTLSKYEITEKDETPGDKSEEITTTSASYVPVNLGFKVKADLGKITPYAYVAPGVAFPVGTKAEIENTETEAEEGEAAVVTKTKTEIEATYAPGFIISSGLGLIVNVSDNIGIKFEFAPTVGSARLKEEKRTYKNGSTSTTIYEKDAKLPNDKRDQSGSEVTHNTNYSHSNQKTSLSSAALKIGIQIAF